MKIVQSGRDEKILERCLQINSDDGWVSVGADWFGKFPDTFFIADDAGFAAVTSRFKYDRNGVELDVISVRKTNQGRGIGRSLMNAVAEFASKTGKDLVYTFCSESNAGALSFYERLGFQKCGILRDRYGEGKHSIILRKSVK